MDFLFGVSVSESTATLPAPPAPITPLRQASSFPLGIVIAGIALALSAAGLVACLAQFFGANSGYSDRFIILIASGWLVWNYRGQLPASPGSPLGLPLILAGSVACVPAWYLASQVGPRAVLLWWLTTSWIVAAAGLALVAGGWPWLRRLAFPLVLLVFALPIPDRLLIPMQNWLQGVTTIIAEQGLSLIGLQVSRKGYELYLPSGGLEVVEACSGVRSITALLAIAVFVAHMRGFGLVRGLLLLALALPVIALVNGLRIILTGWIQETFGQEWIQGRPHELLGTAMVLVGLGMVVFLSHLMRLRAPAAGAAAASAPLQVQRSFWHWPAAAILVAGATGSGLAYTEGDQRAVANLQAAPFEQMPLTIGDWTSDGDKPIPEMVKELLTYDNAICRVYRDPVGHQVEVWVIYWQASTAIRGYHHPDVCFPNRGWETAHKDEKPLKIDDNLEIMTTLRHFSRGRERVRLTYWTQEGQRVWTREDEDNADKGGPGHNWIVDRLVANPPELSARLAVSIKSELTGRGDREERVIEDFTRRFAGSLYELCPWAKPPTPARPGP